MTFSVEIENSTTEALIYCLNKLNREIPDFESEWRFSINALGIDYGIYLNFDTEEKEVEISNSPKDSGGDDYLEDVINAINEEYEEECEEE